MMELEEKYNLLETVTGLGGPDDITVPAWEKATGRLAFVHILAGGYNPETKALLISIGALAPEERKHVLAAGDYSGSPYVVTDALPWGSTLRNWLKTAGGKGAPVEQRPADPLKFSKAGAWKIPVPQPGSR